MARTGTDEAFPKSVSANLYDMLCGHGPMMMRFRPDALCNSAKASRSLSTKLSYQPPTEKTGTWILGRCSLVLMARQKASKVGWATISRNISEVQPVAATSEVRRGRWSTNLEKSGI